MLQLNEKLRDSILNCMVTGIYPNTNYITVNQIINELAKLESVKKKPKPTVVNQPPLRE